MGKAKRERGERRLAELKRLGSVKGYEVHEFSKIHVRVHGERLVDYWPTTGKAWVLGGAKAQNGAEPKDVIDLAMVAPVVEHEAAKAHMQSIATDESEVPW